MVTFCVFQHPLYAKQSNKMDEHCKKEVWHEYEVLEKLLEGHEWAAGDFVTLADFGLLPTVKMLQVRYV